MAGQLVAAGTNGLVLFNRFYQPDLDIEAMEVEPALELTPRPSCGCRCAGSPSCTAATGRRWPPRPGSNRRGRLKVLLAGADVAR